MWTSFGKSLRPRTRRRQGVRLPAGKRRLARRRPAPSTSPPRISGPRSFSPSRVRPGPPPTTHARKGGVSSSSQRLVEDVTMGSSPHTVVSDATQEVRFATAMTGGVSLAIWMGGVARELNLLDQASREREGAETVPPESLDPADQEVRRHYGEL